MRENPNELYVFDICNTLYDSNTTFDFIWFVLEKKKYFVKKLMLGFIAKKQSPLFLILALLQRAAKLDLPKQWALRLLADSSKEELYRLGREFYSTVLENKKVGPTHDLLVKAASSKARVLLLSSSIDPVVAAIADGLGVDYESSQLSYTQGIFRGALSRELAGRKLNSVAPYLRDENTKLTVITDNPADKELVEAADRRYVVIGHERAKARWDYLKPIYIQLSK